LTDAELKAALAGTLKSVNMAKMPAYWDGVIHSANLAARQEITAHWRGQDFTDADILLWDRFDTFNRYLGIYFAVTEAQTYVEKTEGQSLRAMGDLWLKKLAGEERLFAAGVEKFPPATETGGSASGMLQDREDFEKTRGVSPTPSPVSRRAVPPYGPW
jgi:hypothetical protein